MSEFAREVRAVERRARMTLSKTTLGPHEADCDPVRGAEAMSLVHRLTRESWAFSGLPEPNYSRDQIPCRFVPWPLAS